MIQADNPLISAEIHPTQHAMLIIWGHFARTAGRDLFADRPPKASGMRCIRTQAGFQAVCPDLNAWFPDYNGRQTIEAGNKEEKTTFKVQHLMSRSSAGIRIQAMLTVFAANFVRWADEWIRPQIEHSSARFDRALSSPKRLVRVAANSPATVDHSQGHVRVRFSPLSSFEGVVIDLAETTEHPLTGPSVANHHFSSN